MFWLISLNLTLEAVANPTESIQNPGQTRGAKNPGQTRGAKNPGTRGAKNLAKNSKNQEKPKKNKGKPGFSLKILMTRLKLDF